MADPYAEFDDLIQWGQIKAAEELIFDWIRDHPSDARAWVLYGKCVSDLNQKRQCFRRALALDPGNSEAQSLLTTLEPASRPPSETTDQAPKRKSPPQPFVPAPQASTPEAHILGRKPPALSEHTQRTVSFILYGIAHLLSTGLLGVALIVAFSNLVPGLLKIQTSTETIQRGWISNSSPSGADATLQGVANIFVNPSSIDYRNVSNYQDLKLLRTRISADSATAQPVKFMGAQFVGQLVGGNVLQSGKDGRPLIVVMQLDFDGNRIPIVYYGPVGNFNYRDTLLVDGVYIAEANAVAAQQVQVLATSASTGPASETLIVLRMAGLVAVWTLLCVSIFLWKLNLRRWWKANAIILRQAAILLLLVPFAAFLTGCSIDLSTSLRPDGTGITTILSKESRQNMDFLRSAPGISGYLAALTRAAKQSGAMFDQYVEGDQEYSLVERVFNNSVSEAGATYPIAGSWISVQRYREGDEEVTRFLGLVDTRALYNSSTQVGSEAASALRDQLNQMSMTYHLSVPGRLVYQNGDEATSQRVSWTLRMNDSNYLVAESRLPAQTAVTASASSRYIWVALALVFALSTLLLLTSIWIRTPRSTPTRGKHESANQKRSL